MSRYFVSRQALKENEAQTRMWEEYKKRHEKVIEALGILPKELSLNCMVPLGKLAMMKGKLCHTNEILVFLGDGYFAKYSALQAADLCRRRVARTYKPYFPPFSPLFRMEYKNV